MRTFRCACSNRLFFDNSLCLKCQNAVGFSVTQANFVLLDEKGKNSRDGLRPCANYGSGLCNWVLDADATSDLCLACRLNVELLQRVEQPKRRLVFSLLDLGLPVIPLNEDPTGVGFALRRGTPDEPVIIGHADGLITLDLNEADPARREEARQKLGEDYRTLLGHFRHEVGHYYWTRFFLSDAELERFRSVFGDERADYSEALKTHYANPRTDFQDTHVSSYATSHPWEDWAETWAHYLHILDSWQTAVTFGLRTHQGDSRSFKRPIQETLDDWCELMIALNSMNRSMGHSDAYPFQLAATVREKLSFIDEIVKTATSTPALTRSKQPAA
jgi:hypothetical protein